MGGLRVGYTSALLASVLFLLVLSHCNKQELMRGYRSLEAITQRSGLQVVVPGHGRSWAFPYALATRGGSVRSG